MEMKERKFNETKKYFFYLTILTISLVSCSSQARFAKNGCNPDKVYLEWMRESGVDTKSFKKNKINCKTISRKGDSTFVREYYSDNIYFEGNLWKGIKFGIWNGYFKKTKIIETAYLGEEKRRPIFVELWNINGEHIRYTKFNLALLNKIQKFNGLD